MFDFEFKAQSRADDLAEIDLDDEAPRHGLLTDQQRDNLLLEARRDAALAVFYAKSIRNVSLIIVTLAVAILAFVPLKFGAAF